VLFLEVLQSRFMSCADLLHRAAGFRTKSLQVLLVQIASLRL
jgi:hypothetical protein